MKTKKLMKMAVAGGLALIMLLSACTPSTTATSKPGTTTTNKPGTNDTEGTGAIGSSEGDGTTEERDFVKFTVYSLDDAPDYMEWPLVKEAKEKFNFDFDIQQVAWDSWAETTRTLVSTESLPEVVAWYDLGNYSEYVSWVEQDVFKAFPDLSNYPELQKIAKDYSIVNKLEIDGQLYAFPKIINNNPWNEYDSTFVIYRKDWAKAIGKDYADVQSLTWDEFVEFLKEIQDKDPGKIGDKLVPFDIIHGGYSWLEEVKWMFNGNLTTFEKNKAGEYVWGAENPASLAGIEALGALYKDGLLLKDSFTDVTGAGGERFKAGRSATLHTTYSPVYLQSAMEEMIKNLNLTEEDIGLIALQNNEGQYPVVQKIEWWSAFAFSNKCSDAVMTRWLEVANWMLEQSQIEAAAYGIPGEDWNTTEDKVNLNWTSEDVQKGEAKSYINDQKTFQKLFILEGMDTWLPGNPAVSTYFVDDLYQGIMKKYAENPLYTPLNYDVQFFTSPEYGEVVSSLEQEIRDAIIKAVISSDPAKEWNNFLASKKDDVAIACAELNAGLN